MMTKTIVRLVLKILSIVLLSVIWTNYHYDGIPEPWAGGLNDLVGFLLFAISFNLVIAVLLTFYRKHKKMQPDEQDNLTKGVNNIYYLILVFAFIGFCLGLWGIDFKSLFTSLSIFAAAIAIISKEYITPVLAGIIIAFSKNISIGDYVSIGEYRGKVIDLSISKIALMDEDDDVIYIPNDKAYSSEIVNFTRGDVRRISITFELDPNFKGSVDGLEENLIRSLDEYQDCIVPSSFQLRILKIEREAISFKFQYTLHNTDRELDKEIKKKTIRKVLNYLKTH